MLARTYARFLPKYLPGKPIVLVRNMPGGDGIIGSNYVYFSKPDGHTALIQGQGPTLASLLNMPGLKFSSFTEFTACMAPPSVAELFYVGSALGWSGKPEDIANIKGIIYGGSGIYPGALFVAAKEFINIPTEKVVFGYGGAADALRAFLSGEINAVGNTSTGYYNNVRPLYEKGEVQFLFQGGMFDDAGNLVRHPVFPADVPTGPELFEKIYGKLPSGPAYEAYKAIVGGVNSISKALLLPPGTPDAVKQAYWAATKDIIKDPEFLLSANPIAGAEGEWLAGETVDRLFKQFGMKAETRDWFKDLLRAKYSVIVD